MENAERADFQMPFTHGFVTVQDINPAWTLSSQCVGAPGTTPSWSIATVGTHAVPTSTYAAFLESRIPYIQETQFLLEQLDTGVFVGKGAQLNLSAMNDALFAMNTQFEAMSQAINTLRNVPGEYSNQVQELSDALTATYTLQQKALQASSVVDVVEEVTANCPLGDLWLALDTCPNALCNLSLAASAIVGAAGESVSCQTQRRATSISYVCGTSIDAPVLSVDTASDQSTVVALVLSHRCFCTPTPTLATCSAVKQAQLKQQHFVGVVHGIQNGISSASVLLIAYVMYKEFKQRSAALRQHEGVSSFWHRFRAIGVAVDPVRLLSNGWGAEYVTQTASAWFMIYTIVVYWFLGLAGTSSSMSYYEFAYQIMFIYLPLTLCDNTQFQRLGSYLGLSYSCVLIAEAVIEFQMPNARAYFHWIIYFSFVLYFVPLVAVMWVFGRKIWMFHVAPSTTTPSILCVRNDDKTSIEVQCMG